MAEMEYALWCYQLMMLSSNVEYSILFYMLRGYILRQPSSAWFQKVKLFLFLLVELLGTRVESLIAEGVEFGTTKGWVQRRKEGPVLRFLGAEFHLCSTSFPSHGGRVTSCSW